MTTDHDDELEAFLQRRSPLQQRFPEPDRLEPPPELDRIVLSRAREAIRAPVPEPVFRPVRWALPFSLAAVLVLTFAVVLSFRMTQDAGTAFVVTADSAAPAPAAAAQPEATTEAATPRSAAPRLAAKPQPQDPAQFAFAPTRGASGTAQADREEYLARTRAAGSAAESKSSADVALAMNEVREQVAAAQAGSTELEKRSGEPQDEDQATATTAIADVASSGVEDSPAPAVASRNRSLYFEAPHAASPARDPAVWLKRIEQLRAAGKTSEAQREWEAFRKAYPNHPSVRTSEPASAEKPPLAEQTPPAEQPPSEPAR